METELFAFISKYMILTDEEKNAIIELDIFRKFAKGTVLLEAGAESDRYYFVIKGCVRCYYMVDGEEKTTAFYKEAETVAPGSYGPGSPSPFYLSCVEDSILTVATPEMEKLIFDKFPRFESLCRFLAEELLAKSQASFAEFMNSTPEQRYLNLLETRPPLIQRVPQYQLASYLGIKPESLSRIRKRLVKQGKS